MTARLRLPVLRALLIGGLLTSSALHGQVYGAPGSGGPTWLCRWSPLTPLAELPRSLPGYGLVPPALLVLPAPRVGPFWTAGNPGALPADVVDDRADFRLGRERTYGDFRRPLDEGTSDSWTVSGMGWGSLGGVGGGIGQVVVDRTEFGDGAYSNVLFPYATEPYSVLDTLGEAMSGTSVLIQGAGGWRPGAFSFGLGLGYYSRDQRTVESAVPRTHTVATPGVTAGISYDVSDGTLLIGAYGRWTYTAESVSIFSLQAPSRVYRLGGYYEPVAVDLVSNLYSRRFERYSWAAGLSAGGKSGSVVWSLYAQLERLASENFGSFTAAAPTDTWDARGWTGGGALQAPIGQRFLLTLQARYTALMGEAHHSDIEGIPFSVEESRIESTAELRLKPQGSWEAAMLLGLGRDQRLRSDGLAGVYTDIETWLPLGALEVARWLGPGIAVSIGASIAEHNPAGAIPIASEMGPVYQNWIAPEVELEAAGGSAWAVLAAVRWQVRPATGLYLESSYGSSKPPKEMGMLPSAPQGGRQHWRTSVGVIIGTGR